jgi:pimeloyl-ACP methyl ester carboxylesterase
MTEKVFVTVEDGEKIAAVEHEADSERWFFVCHGLASNKDRGGYKALCEKAVEEGFNAVRFDFRGNGESDGRFSEQTVKSKIKDLKAVADFFSPESYVLFGSSFGGKIAFHATEGLEPEALILQKPVLLERNSERYERLSKEGEWERYGGKSWDMEFVQAYRDLNFEEVAEGLDVRVLIFHGSEDEIIGFEDTLDAVKGLETDVVLRKLYGEEHSFSEEAQEKVREESFRRLKNEF